MRPLACLGLGLILLLAGPAAAVPVAVGIGSFSGSATLVDFNGIPNKTLISNAASSASRV